MLHVPTTLLEPLPRIGYSHPVEKLAHLAEAGPAQDRNIGGWRLGSLSLWRPLMNLYHNLCRSCAISLISYISLCSFRPPSPPPTHVMNLSNLWNIQESPESLGKPSFARHLFHTPDCQAFGLLELVRSYSSYLVSEHVCNVKVIHCDRNHPHAIRTH